MQIVIKVNLDGDSFVDQTQEELQRVLDARKIINRLADNDYDRIGLVDSNGNTCGFAQLED